MEAKDSDILYKYVPPDCVSYFSDQLLRFTQPAALNDPFERIPILSTEETHEVAREFVRAIAADAENKASRYERRKARQTARQVRTTVARQLQADPDLLRRTLYERADKKLNSSIGILSLSSRWDSGLMWSHYALAHQGLCIGFQRRHPVFAGDSIKGMPPVLPVAYSDRRIKVPVERGQKIDFRVMYTKSKDWTYEREERALRLLVEADRRIDATPYPLCLFKIPHDAVAEVTLGLRAGVAVAQEAARFCSAKNVPLFRAVVSDTTFDVSRIKDSVPPHSPAASP
jgi:Protein of unknown function (DUF2971)